MVSLMGRQISFLYSPDVGARYSAMHHQYFSVTSHIVVTTLPLHTPYVSLFHFGSWVFLWGEGGDRRVIPMFA